MCVNVGKGGSRNVLFCLVPELGRDGFCDGLRSFEVMTDG